MDRELGALRGSSSSVLLQFVVIAFYRGQLGLTRRDLAENDPHSLDVTSNCEIAAVRVDAATENLSTIIVHRYTLSYGDGRGVDSDQPPEHFQFGIDLAKGEP
jgi:hypothetical protein